MNPLKLFGASGGALSIGGLGIERIAAKLKTPFYIYGAAIMRRQYRALRAALPRGTAIHYSLKANPNLAVASVFSRLGAGSEAASACELETALAAGFPADRILFAGPGKSGEDLKLAVEKRIGSINIESETELERVITLAGRAKSARAGGPVRVSFRVNLNLGAGAGGEIMTGGPRKFGVDEESVAPLVSRALREKKIEFLGFHFFTGTQITDSKVLSAAHERFADWVEGFARSERLRIKSLNFGGGLGIPFRDGEPELDVRALGRSMTRIRAKLDSSPFFKGARFIVEPGRYLAGPAGIYVTRVTDIKKSRGRVYVITDGGIHHALVPIVLNKNYPSAILNRINERRTAQVTVAGPLCASADQFSRSLKLPQPRIGDLLGIFNSGAYGYTAGMLYFLSHPTPSEALVDGGKLYLIREPRKPERGTRKAIRL